MNSGWHENRNRARAGRRSADPSRPWLGWRSLDSHGGHDRRHLGGEYGSLACMRLYRTTWTCAWSYMGLRERADHDVIAIRIRKCKFSSPCRRVHVWLLVETRHKSASAMQRHVKVVDTEEQEKPISRLRGVRTPQGRVIMGTPLVEAQQDGSILVADLSPVFMSRSSSRPAKERLVPMATARYVCHSDNCPCALHGVLTYGRDIRIQC